MERRLTCAFTGHRPKHLPWGEDEKDKRCAELKRRLDKSVEKAYADGFRHFLCGMARGADFYFCESVIALRNRHPEICLEAAVPYLKHGENWAWKDYCRYQHLLAQCDLETLIQRDYNSFCMHRRDIYLVDHASRLIAVFNGDPGGGGTLFTLSYALSRGVSTDILEL